MNINVSEPQDMSIPVPQKDLNLWRKFFDILRVSCRRAARDIDAGNPHAARRVIDQTEDAGRRMAMRLERAGATPPDGPEPQMFEIPLQLLDTPANRLFAQKLDEAWQAALAVDRERYGADIGTDGPAQIIEMMLDKVKEEVGGAPGAGLE